MTNKHPFEYRHERTSLFAAADKFYEAVTLLPAQPRSSGLARKLEGAASTIAICLAEAVDLAPGRVKRLAKAVECSITATAILRLMRTGKYIDAETHQRALQLLRVVSIKLDLLSQAAAVGAKPKAEAGPLDELLRVREPDDTLRDDASVPAVAEPDATPSGEPAG